MSNENLNSTYPKGPAVRVDTADPVNNRPVYPGQKLDKTLRHVDVGLPKGPEKTPGGHGQVWRDR